MKLSYIKFENTVVVYPAGRLDVHLSLEIEKEINLLIKSETARHFVFNLQDVEYLSSSGLTLFLSVMNSLKLKGKKFIICNPSCSVTKIIELVEMTSLFEIFKTEKDAFEFLSRQRIIKKDMRKTFSPVIINACNHIR